MVESESGQISLNNHHGCILVAVEPVLYHSFDPIDYPKSMVTCMCLKIREIVKLFFIFILIQAVPRNMYVLQYV